jgi:hypothetical protein
MTTMQMKLELVAVPVSETVCKGSAIGRKSASLADHKDFFKPPERPLHTVSHTNVRSNKQQTHDKNTSEEKQNEQRSTRF